MGKVTPFEIQGSQVLKKENVLYLTTLRREHSEENSNASLHPNSKATTFSLFLSLSFIHARSATLYKILLNVQIQQKQSKHSIIRVYSRRLLCIYYSCHALLPRGIWRRNLSLRCYSYMLSEYKMINKNHLKGNHLPMTQYRLNMPRFEANALRRIRVPRRSTPASQQGRSSVAG